MTKKSAGLLMYRRASGIEVLLVHPGGPFWAKKDDGAWSIPKGEYADDEEALDAAIREFEEELGCRPASTFAPKPNHGEPESSNFVELGQANQASGKLVSAWAFEGDWDPANLKSDTFEIEWPPKSGKMAEFPEVDRAAWFDVDTAKVKINSGQASLIDTLLSKL